MSEDNDERPLYLKSRGWFSMREDAWHPPTMPGVSYPLEKAYRQQIRNDLFAFAHLIRNLDQVDGVKLVASVTIADLVLDVMKRVFDEIKKDEDRCAKEIAKILADPETRALVQHFRRQWRIWTEELDKESAL